MANLQLPSKLEIRDAIIPINFTGPPGTPRNFSDRTKTGDPIRVFFLESTPSYTAEQIATVLVGQPDTDISDLNTTFQSVRVSDRQRLLDNSFGAWSRLANINFVVTADMAAADIRVGVGSLNGNSINTIVPKLDGSNKSWNDVYISPLRYNPASIAASPVEFFSPGRVETGDLLHEVGHAIGLQHPAEGQGGGTLPAEFNRLWFNAMSNRTKAVDGFTPTTPMLMDAVGLEAIYGMRTGINAGDTLHRLDSAGGPVSSTDGDTTGKLIHDTGGSDDTLLAEYVNEVGANVVSTKPSHIDLRPGHFSSINLRSTELYNVAVWYDSEIENATGGRAGDKIIGNDLANALNGGNGDGNTDEMEGGIGSDTYVFNQAFGRDRVYDSDGLGSIRIDNQPLDQIAFGGGYGGVWSGKLSGGQALSLRVESDPTSSITGQRLVITKGQPDGKRSNAADSITISNFNLTQALSPQGYLGIKLDSNQRAALTQTMGAPPFIDYGFNPASASGSVGLGEGKATFFTVYLSNGAKAGDTVVLSVTDGASLKAVVNGEPVAAHGATFTLTEGQTRVSFALMQDGEIASDFSASVSAIVHSGASSVASNGWTVNVADAGAAANTFVGDYAVATEVNEGPALFRGAFPVVPIGQDRYLTDGYGHLLPGAGAVVTSNTFFGSPGNDEILGLGGNDALGSGAGNDKLDGGLGDDLMSAGTGADRLYGGAGNDTMVTSGNLQVTQALGPNDNWMQWGLPAGATATSAGQSWGLYTSANGVGVIPSSFGVGGGTDGDAADGGAGNDEIYASEGADTVNGGADNDWVQGLGGADIVLGAQGSDILFGDGHTNPAYFGYSPAENSGADFIDGGEGNDELIGGGAGDFLLGGGGADWLYGDEGQANDFYSLVIPVGLQGDDWLDGGAGNDDLWGDGGRDALFGGIGNDGLWGGAGQDELFGGDGNDVLMGDFTLATDNDGADYLDGGAGDDVLRGGGLNDVLIGGAGTNQLYGDGGDDVLVSTGNDLLNGGAGNDTYDLTASLGSVRISDNSGNDRIILGWSRQDMSLARGSLVLVNNVTGQEVHLEEFDDQAPGGGLSIESVELAGGEVVAMEDILELGMSIDGTEDDDVLVGSAIPDAIRGFGGNDSMTGGEGRDRLLGGDGDDVLDGGMGADVMDGGDGDDIYLVDNIDDTLMDSAGQDLVRASIDYALGDGLENLTLDPIEDDPGLFAGLHGTGNELDNVLTDGKGVDTLEGKAGDDIYIIRSSSDIVIEQADEGHDVIRLDTGLEGFDYGGFTGYMLPEHVEELDLGNFSGATSVQGNSAANTITGSGMGDHIDGGAGDDVLRGGQPNSLSVLPDLAMALADFLAAWQPANGSPRSGSAFISEFQMLEEGYVNEYLGVYEDDDGNLLPFDPSQYVSGEFWIRPWPIHMYGPWGDELTEHLWPLSTFPLAAVVDAARASAGSDSLWGGLGDDTLDGCAGDDLLMGGEGNDVLVDSGASNSSGLYSTFRLSWDDPETRMYVPFTMTSNDTLEGGAGNDNLNGGSGGDTYRFQAGDGSDVVAEQAFEDGDALVFASNVLTSSVNLQRAGNNLVIAYGTGDTVTVQDWFAGTVHKIGSIRFHDGTDLDAAQVEQIVVDGGGVAPSPGVGVNLTGSGTLVGTPFADTLAANAAYTVLQGMGGNDTLGGPFVNSSTTYFTFEGGTGDDMMTGSYGKDTYLFSLGDGHDTINDDVRIYSSGANYFQQNPDDTSYHDRLEFGAGINPADVTAAQDGNDLILTLGGGTDSIRIKKWFDGTIMAKIEQIAFANGTVWSAADVESRVNGGAQPNHAPIANQDVTAQFAEQGQAWSFVVPSGTLADQDPDDALTYTATLANGTALPGWLSFDAETLTFSGTAGSAGSLQVKVTATDESGLSAASQFDLTVYDSSGLTLMGNGILVGSNYADRLSGNMAGTVLQGKGGNDTLGGPFVNSSTTYFTFNGGAGEDTMTGTYAKDTYLFGLGDGNDTIDDDVRTYSNGASYFQQNPGDTSYQDRLEFGAGINPADVTAAQDGSDLILTLGGGTDSIRIKKWFDGTIMAKIEEVVFANGAVWSVADIEARVSGGVQPNHAPTVAQALESKFTEQGQAWSFVVPSGTFADEDAGDMLTYTATLGSGAALPGWLSFDAATRTFSGTPPTGAGALQLKVTATDESGLSVAGLFGLTVYDTGGLTLVGNGTLVGTNYADRLSGNMAGAVLQGKGGNDTLGGPFVNSSTTYFTFNGGAGDDTMTGTYAKDTYLFGLGDGHDTIDDDARIYSNGASYFQQNPGDTSYHDRLEFSAGINPADVMATQDGNDLVLTLAGGNDGIRVKKWFDGSIMAKIEEVAFANGTVWSVVDVEDLAANGSGTTQRARASADGSVILETSAGSVQGSDNAEGALQPDYVSFTTESDTGAGSADWQSLFAGQPGWQMDAYNSGYFGGQALRSDEQVLSKPLRVDSEVQKLVQAMASFSPPAAGETAVRPSQDNSLNTLVATHWQ